MQLAPERGSAQSGTYSNITEYAVPSANTSPSEIAAGPDGALWFTELNNGKIGGITTAGVFTEYPLTNNPAPYAITAGPDGALWFTQLNIIGFGRITTNGAITIYSGSGSDSFGIAAGSDGALWFTERSSRIGRLTTDGVVTNEYSLQNANALPWGITAGPDGALWFTEFDGNKIGRITTGGVITEYPLPPNASPYTIASGPDGALWFTEYYGNKIGRITTAGAITEYSIPTVDSRPYRIASGPGGALWFTEFNANRIGRVTTAGVVTDYPITTAGSEPVGIAGGPDGALWFTGQQGGKVGRAPSCGLGFSASFSSSTLTMNFDLGIDTAATFDILLRNSSGPIGEPFSKEIGPVAPPQAFTERWHNVPSDLGAFTVQPVLTAGSGQAICSEWTTVNTGAAASQKP